MAACNGRGADGDHCCYINGKPCEFLFPWVARCSLRSEWGRLHENKDWRESPVGQFFLENYPAYDCGDWPQRIPEVMEQAKTAGPFYACCFGRGNDGNMG